jgi:hypothetical protein
MKRKRIMNLMNEHESHESSELRHSGHWGGFLIHKCHEWTNEEMKRKRKRIGNERTWE